MALTALEQNTISKGLILADKLMTLYGEMQELNVIYDSGGGVKDTLSTKTVDIEATYQGLTKTLLEDGMYAITSSLKTVIDGAKTQLIQLSARN